MFALSKSHPFSYLKLIQAVLFIYIFPTSKSGSGPLFSISFFFTSFGKKSVIIGSKNIYVPHLSVAVSEILLDLIP